MRSLRTPVVFLVVSLGLTLFTFTLYVAFWLDNPGAFNSLANALAFCAVLSTLFIVVAVGSAVAVVRTHNAPLPGPTVGLIVLGLVVGLILMLMMGATMGQGTPYDLRRPLCGGAEASGDVTSPHRDGVFTNAPVVTVDSWRLVRDLLMMGGLALCCSCRWSSPR